VVTTLTDIGDSVSTKVEGLTRSNDQKLELLRSGMEQRMDSFTTESARKIDGLTLSVATSSGRLQDEVSGKLVERSEDWRRRKATAGSPRPRGRKEC
jgi:hypothetical protein